MENIPFKRHVLCQMQQLEEETIDQFMCWVHQQAISCEFASLDENGHDEIIKKWRVLCIRCKFLENSSGATLVIQ